MSVVIPAYNAASYVSMAIRSVYMQAYRPLEVLVVNDASKDITLQVVEKAFASGPSNVKKSMVDIRENSGTANALARGFSEAAGDYVCWLSADDAFVNQAKTEVQIKHMLRKQAAWSYFRNFYYGPTPESSRVSHGGYLPHMKFLEPLFERDPELRSMCLLYSGRVNGSSVMINRECFQQYGLFDPVLRNIDPDGDLWLRYSALGLHVASIPGSPIFYRVHEGQTSQQGANMRYGIELVRLRFLTALSKHRMLDQLIRRFSPIFVWLFLNGKTVLPYTTQFLCERILANREDYSPVILPFARMIYTSARQKKQSSDIERNELMSSVKRALKSEEFLQFEKLLAFRS